MNREDFDLITFDCYGTLIDWESGIFTAIQTEAARDGVSLDREQIISAYMAVEPEVESQAYRPYRQVLAETASRVSARLGWSVDRERASFLADSVPSWEPFADTNPALERLASRFKLGILSNIDDDILAATLRHFAVDFELIVTAQQVRSYKPGHAHFLEARRRAANSRLLHAAQSYFHDVVPARELEIPVVWVNRNAESIPEGGASPTREVSNLAELADLLGA
ncbi:MAG TPA: HAD family hydrolase [Blastocatellia bacterium]|nr:HAD family hydrolase [Blastocatellia bacterium]